MRHRSAVVSLAVAWLIVVASARAETPTGVASSQEEAVVLESAAREGTAPLVGDAPPVPGDATPVVRILGDTVVPRLPFLGVDTERGDRVKHNLLRAPIRLTLRNRDGTSTETSTLPCVVERGGEHGDDVVRYRITLAPDATLVWEIATAQGQWQMKLSREGATTPQFAGVDVVLPLNPRTCATSIVAGQWSKTERFALPAILSAPDLGQFHVTLDGDDAAKGAAEGSFIGQRGIFGGGEQGYWMDLTFHLSMPDERGVALNFAPLVLPKPANVDPELWRQARRGWFNLYQLSSKWPRPGGARGAPAGLIANNVLSDPVSSLLWYHGDQALLIPELAPGVRATDVLRHTIEFWLYDAIEPDGQVWYVAAEKYQMMDANPAILIAAWCYVEATGDLEWAKKHLPRLELIAEYLAKRDIDGDGLVESVQSGNAGEITRLGDTSIDTIKSGHKNAWVNALVFRAWRGLADIEKKLDRADAAQRYRALSDKLRAAYAPTFINPETGLLIWWRSEDGKIHDYASVIAATYAVEYGLLDEAQSRALMDALWKKIDAVGYTRFDIGVPCNLVSVPPDEQCNPGGNNGDGKSDKFEHYCNGGVFPQMAINAMTASWTTGKNDRADHMFHAMLERQDKGVFPNGGGFQTGIVADKIGEGPEILDWNGKPTGYEGHCVRDCSFVMGVFLRDEGVRAKVYRPVQ